MSTPTRAVGQAALATGLVRTSPVTECDCRNALRLDFAEQLATTWAMTADRREARALSFSRTAGHRVKDQDRLAVRATCSSRAR
jgi:hypothetical protein